MQEEVEQKSLTLTVNAAKMTTRLFRTAVTKYMGIGKKRSTMRRRVCAMWAGSRSKSWSGRIRV